ncbi:MAG: methylated-DNA--[protein]-cysteine S-methyltransferase [Nitrospiraceae bacterium]|nr:methylated-DNA--[protein]-cysteine S-methyltransferase [Nitrospiraceae bacterium]
MNIKTSGKAELFYDVFESPLGELFLMFSGPRLSGISFKKPNARRGAVPEQFKKELNDYFAGRIRDFRQSVVFLKGTDFEKQVWNILKKIPYGETRTYKWIAEQIGKPKANRAVGRALGKNPIPIVYPCHRIIESDGSIGGFSSGVDIKRRLLELEYYNFIG